MELALWGLKTPLQACVNDRLEVGLGVAWSRLGLGGLEVGVEVLAGEVSGGSEFGSCHNPVTLKVQFRLIHGFASKLIVL